MDRATSPQESLLAAGRALLAVADGPVDDVSLRAEELGWLCSSLLPPNLQLGADADARRPPRFLLREAEEELRRFPICAYPAGTIDLVVGLCDLLRETAESPR